MEQAKRIRRRWPGQREWVWCWDVTPWGGGHLRDNGAVGAVRLPECTATHRENTIYYTVRLA
jgi:hypothetical protein